MIVYIPYLAQLRQDDLLEEAELRRRSRLVRRSEPVTPAWRRRLGGLLSSAARSLDPSLDGISETAVTTGRGANALPAC